MNRCCNKGDWFDEEGSVGAERAKEGNKTAGLQCDGCAYSSLQMRNMDSAKEALK